MPRSGPIAEFRNPTSRDRRLQCLSRLLCGMLLRETDQRVQQHHPKIPIASTSSAESLGVLRA